MDASGSRRSARRSSMGSRTESKSGHHVRDADPTCLTLINPVWVPTLLSCQAANPLDNLI